MYFKIKEAYASNSQNITHCYYWFFTSATEWKVRIKNKLRKGNARWLISVDHCLNFVFQNV
jgi:hypothetical protein